MKLIVEMEDRVASVRNIARKKNETLAPNFHISYI